LLSAVVLAAGEARRMNPYHKPLLPLRGVTFLEGIVHIMIQAGADEFLVVIGHEHERITAAVQLPEVRFVFNEAWRSGQLSSLRTAVRALSPESEGMLFTPVDHPLVSLSTYRILIEQWLKDKDRLVIPRHGGRKGHPAIFPARLYGPLLHEELQGGARDLIYREMESVLFMNVGDPGVIHDIDTPDDYRRLIGELP
jgi:CTP:molybdopterin cytidylyltransferase MocA